MAALVAFIKNYSPRFHSSIGARLSNMAMPAVSFFKNIASLKKLNFFTLALLGSAIVHLAFILFVKFEQPALQFFKDHASNLDVVLVNSKSKARPTKADALAQANLNGGGNTEANRRLKSALPWQKTKHAEIATEHHTSALESALATTEAEAARKAQRLAELEKQAQSLMTQLNATHSIDANPTQKSAPPIAGKGTKEAATSASSSDNLVASSMEIARLEAQIAKEQDDYQKRPKRKSIGARAQEYRFAAYVESWRQKVEKIGNLNYPEAAKAEKIHGQLQMTVYIKSDGNIEKIEIKRHSGFPVLDEAAKRIVEMAAPYAVFPEDLRKEVDVLDITRTWTFTKEDSLSTRGAE